MSDSAAIKPTILYIEDEEIPRDTFLEYIRSVYGPDSMGAGSKLGALRLLMSGFKPDLVIHDCQIPVDDGGVYKLEPGNELYRRLVDYRHKSGRRLPIVVLTGNMDRKNQEPYRSYPPIDFLDKDPLDSAKIDQIVDLYRKWLDQPEG